MRDVLCVPILAFAFYHLRRLENVRSASPTSLRRTSWRTSQRRTAGLPGLMRSAMVATPSGSRMSDATGVYATLRGASSALGSGTRH
jgi:hypothetical protein